MAAQTSRTAEAQPPRKQLAYDDKGGVYELGKRIAQGGQGIVCPTQDPRYLVKVSRFPAGDLRGEQWHKQIEAVHRMPIEEYQLPIAMPIAMIRTPRPGYVMELMEGLQPLETLLKEAQDRNLAGFLATGGLRRRMRILARLARVMAKLHGLGIAHGDLSPSNIFVSRSLEHDQTWLIDCDNLTYAVKNSTLQVYTPDYGAPELFRGDAGISTYTDTWSFAVIAFQVLTWLHPFKSGLLVDSDSELEVAAFRGQVPWIDHDSDDSNRATTGLPRELVCTPAMSELFRRCFQDGLNDPEGRPPMSEWAEAFESAAAVQVQCESSAGGCGSTFFWHPDVTCTFCGAPAKGTACRLEYYFFAPPQVLGDGATATDLWTRTEHRLVAGSAPVTLRSSPPGTANYPDSDPVASIWLEDGAFNVKVERGAEVGLQTENTKRGVEPLHGRIKLPATRSRMALHLGRPDAPHGTWHFVW